jgi:hypothetical protein
MKFVAVFFASILACTQKHLQELQIWLSDLQTYQVSSSFQFKQQMKMYYYIHTFWHFGFDLRTQLNTKEVLLCQKEAQKQCDKKSKQRDKIIKSEELFVNIA